MSKRMFYIELHSFNVTNRGSLDRYLVFCDCGQMVEVRRKFYYNGNSYDHEWYNSVCPKCGRNHAQLNNSYYARIDARGQNKYRISEDIFENGDKVILSVIDNSPRFLNGLILEQLSSTRTVFNVSTGCTYALPELKVKRQKDGSIRRVIPKVRMPLKRCGVNNSLRVMVSPETCKKLTETICKKLSEISGYTISPEQYDVDTANDLVFVNRYPFMSVNSAIFIQNNNLAYKSFRKHVNDVYNTCRIFGFDITKDMIVRYTKVKVANNNGARIDDPVVEIISDCAKKAHEVMSTKTGCYYEFFEYCQKFVPVASDFDDKDISKLAKREMEVREEMFRLVHSIDSVVFTYTEELENFKFARKIKRFENPLPYITSITGVSGKAFKKLVIEDFSRAFVFKALKEAGFNIGNILNLLKSDVCKYFVPLAKRFQEHELSFLELLKFMAPYCGETVAVNKFLDKFDVYFVRDTYNAINQLKTYNYEFIKEDFEGSIRDIHDRLERKLDRRRYANVELSYTDKVRKLEGIFGEFEFRLAEDTDRMTDIGERMHICVGRLYRTDAIDGRCIIAFAQDKKRRYALCIELDQYGTKVNQAKTYCNNLPVGELLVSFLDWCKVNNLKINTHDIDNRNVLVEYNAAERYEFEDIDADVQVQAHAVPAQLPAPDDDFVILPDIVAEPHARAYNIQPQEAQLIVEPEQDVLVLPAVRDYKTHLFGSVQEAKDFFDEYGIKWNKLVSKYLPYFTGYDYYIYYSKKRGEICRGDASSLLSEYENENDGF